MDCPEILADPPATSSAPRPRGVDARRRGLTVAQGSALSIGAVLGTGVITLPAVGAKIAGPASLVAWLALVALSIPLATTFAALGARHPDSGGVATYVRKAFGARCAAMVGWCFYFAVPIGAPPAALMAGRYVADAVGGGRTTAGLTAVGLVLTTWALNLFGLRLSGRVQLAMAGTLAVLMVVTMAVALPHADLGAVGEFAPHGWSAVGTAAGLLVWGFAGWEAISSLAAEYRTPARDVPRATGIAVAVVGVLYLGLAVTTVVVLGRSAGDSAAPLSDLMALGIGEAARWLTAVVAVLLTLGAMNAYFAGAGRLGAALARDGALPAALRRGGGPGEVPRRSLTVVGALSLVSLLVTGVAGVDLETIMLLATGSFTLVYVLATAAAVRLLPRRTWAFRAAVVSLLSVLVLLAVIGWHALWALCVCALALAYQVWTERRGSSGPQLRVADADGQERMR